MAERPNLWDNQREALEFTLSHDATMLDMDMGTGKTRVAIEAMIARKGVRRVLVLCPKAVMSVWANQVDKFTDGNVRTWTATMGGNVESKARKLLEWLREPSDAVSMVVVNYDISWRHPMNYAIRSARFDMAIMDESHRIKSAGSKVSKFAALLGKEIRYRMCLSGTPMANSPLDVYGQYRFLDRSIFGTSHARFLDQYAVMSFTTPPFVVGMKNQQELNRKFSSIAYSCRMSDVSDRLKLPDELPDRMEMVTLPPKDMRTIDTMQNEFIAECGGGHIVLDNVLTKMLRVQQICSGYAVVRESPDTEETSTVRVNTAKEDRLGELIRDEILPHDRVVVFCNFTRDLQAVRRATESSACTREYFELSGERNQLEEWKQSGGGVLGVQIQAGAEGVDMTDSHICIYYNLPYSLALYEQSRARLRRPGQHTPVLYVHLLAEGTIDELIYRSLRGKRNLIDDIRSGNVDFSMVRETIQIRRQ